MSKKKMTGAEIMKEDMKQFDADIKSMMEEAAPKTPLEAAIDRATGFKPEDAVQDMLETEQGDSETEQGDSETEQGDSETKPAEDETPAKKPAKRDWVKEAYETFIKNAEGLDPTDPVAAVGAYFEKNASEELKARCKAEGKTAKGCWKFIEAVARKVGGNCHIDPGAVYAMAMHWFEDVPKDWDKPATRQKPAKAATPAKPAMPAKSTKPKKPAETPSEIKKEKAKAKAAKKRKVRQGFFFEMLDAPAEGGAE